MSKASKTFSVYGHSIDAAFKEARDEMAILRCDPDWQNVSYFHIRLMHVEQVLMRAFPEDNNICFVFEVVEQ